LANLPYCGNDEQSRPEPVRQFAPEWEGRLAVERRARGAFRRTRRIEIFAGAGGGALGPPTRRLTSLSLRATAQKKARRREVVAGALIRSGQAQ
jgi:hypothetical protein